MFTYRFAFVFPAMQRPSNIACSPPHTPQIIIIGLFLNVIHFHFIHPQLFGRNIQIINNPANATALRRPQRAKDALRAVAEAGIEEHILVVVSGPHAEAKAVTDLGPCQDEGRHDAHDVWHVVWMYHVREGPAL